MATQQQQITKEKTHTLVFELEDWMCLATAYIGLQRTSVPLRGDDQLTLVGLLLEKFEKFLEPVKDTPEGTAFNKPESVKNTMRVTMPAGMFRMLKELKLGMPWSVEGRHMGIRFSEIMEAAKKEDAPKSKSKSKSKLKEV